MGQTDTGEVEAIDEWPGDRIWKGETAFRQGADEPDHWAEGWLIGFCHLDRLS